MTTTTPDAVQMPPLPANMNRFDIGISQTGERMDYTRTQMHDYAQAYAAQRCAELAAKLAVADARVAELTASLHSRAFVSAGIRGCHVTMSFCYSNCGLFCMKTKPQALTPKEHQ